jgi:CelD/BcsL family acetyltransferase involved in cellulose biosynthesis
MPVQIANEPLTVDSVPSIEAIWQEWSELAERGDNLFLTPEWLSIWWRHYGGGKELCLKACRDNKGRLVALLPLYHWRRRPRVLRFLGHGPSDELGPVCAPDDRERASACLARALEQARGEMLLADYLPGDSDWLGWLPGSRVLGREASPVIEFEDSSWDDFLQTRSRNLRAEVRKRERALRNDFEVSFRLSEPDSLATDIDLLFRLHRANWSKKQPPTDFVGRDEDLQREFIAAAQARGWLRLWIMELDGRPAAAGLGYRFAGSEYGYQSGRDPAWDRFSVGSVLRVHVMQAALEDGVHKFRLLRGAEAFKYRFASKDDALVTLALPRGVVGRAALVGATALLKTKKSLRPLLRRG